VAGGFCRPRMRGLPRFPRILYPVTWDDPIMEGRKSSGRFSQSLRIKTWMRAIREVKKHPKTPFPVSFFSRDQKAIDHFLLEPCPSAGGAINQVNIHLVIENHAFRRRRISRGIGHLLR